MLIINNLSSGMQQRATSRNQNEDKGDNLLTWKINTKQLSQGFSLLLTMR
jgi:hypothetical protein